MTTDEAVAIVQAEEFMEGKLGVPNGDDWYRLVRRAVRTILTNDPDWQDCDDVRAVRVFKIEAGIKPRERSHRKGGW